MQRIASAVSVAEGTVEKRLESAGTRREYGGRPTLGLSRPLARAPDSGPSHDPSSRLIAEVIQSDLEKVGATVNLRIWEYAQLSTAIWKEHPEGGAAATEYDMFMLGWGTITGDADFTLFGTVSDISIPPEGLNATFWAPEPFMELLKKARFATDPTERQAAYHEAQEMLHENAIWIPLVVLNQVVVLRNEVEDYEPHPVEYYAVRLKDVSVRP